MDRIIVRPEDILFTIAGTPEAEQAAAATPDSYCIYTPCDNLATIREAARPLLDAGVTLQGLSLEAIGIVAYLAPKKFAKELKVLKQLCETKVINELIAEAIKSNILTTVKNIPLRPLMKFCTWLKSEAGRAAIATVYYRKKLKEKDQKYGNEVYLQKLINQLETYETLATEYTWRRRSYDVKIAELKRQIEIMERQPKTKVPGDMKIEVLEDEKIEVHEDMKIELLETVKNKARHSSGARKDRYMPYNLRSFVHGASSGSASGYRQSGKN